jgi:hypothetical protein
MFPTKNPFHPPKGDFSDNALPHRNTVSINHWKDVLENVLKDI